MDSSAPVESKPANLTNELAKERNRAGADRTLMAWIRTSLSLITFGFGIDKIIAAINRSKLGNGPSTNLSVSIIATGFIVIGMLSLVAALWEHRQVLHRLAQGDFVYVERRSIAGVTAFLIILLGAFALGAVFIGSL